MFLELLLLASARILYTRYYPCSVMSKACYWFLHVLFVLHPLLYLFVDLRCCNLELLGQSVYLMA